MILRHYNFSNSEINLADLVKALDQLQPLSPHTRQTIARQLGFHLSIEVPEQNTQPIQPESGKPEAKIPEAPVQQEQQTHQPQDWTKIHAAFNPRQQQPKTQSTGYKSGPDIPPAARPPLDIPQDSLNINLNRLPDAETDDSLTGTESIDNPVTNDLFISTAKQTPLKRIRLFPQNTVRSILNESIKQRTTGNEIDTDRLIRAAVKLQHQPCIPCKPAYTINQGCQLLLDFSEGLQVWWQDIRDLRDDFESLLKQDCETWEFRNNPQSSSRWNTHKNEIQPWKINHNKPIVIASDLGLCRYKTMDDRYTPEQWKIFINRYSQTHNIIVFTPYFDASQLRENNITKNAKLIHWHPNTRLNSIRELIRGQ